MIFYVINLDRSPERWEVLQRHAIARGLRLERIAAVDGRDPRTLEDAGYHPRAADRYRLLPEEVACFESHKRAWARIAGAPDAFGVVLEDDVFLAAEAADVLDALVSQCPSLDLVKLNAAPGGLHLRRVPLALLGDRAVMQPMRRSIDASAYLISHGYARRALDLHQTYAEPVDRVLFDPATCSGLAQIDPGLTVQAKYAAFRFLDGEAGRTTIQIPHGARLRWRMPQASDEGPLTKVARELRRFTSRRIAPATQPFLNLFRAPADRQVFRRVSFRSRDA